MAPESGERPVAVGVAGESHTDSVAPSSPAILAAVTDAPGTRLADVLNRLAEELCRRLDADACAISRVIGDVLILVAEKAPEGTTLQLGQGYLVSDFPLTVRVLETGEAAVLTLEDTGVDEAEAELLLALGFAALLMLPLVVDGAPWGLVEVYRRAARAFTADEIAIVNELARLS